MATKAKQNNPSFQPLVAVEKPADAPNVSYVRPEVTAMHTKWSQVEDCLGGQETVKSKGIQYLPKPDAANESAENTVRYQHYVERAVFYNVTRKTLNGLVGEVFCRDPIVKLPSRMDAMLDDIDGTGISLFQQSKKGLSFILAYGRFGLLVDYPKTNGATSIADQEAGFIHPTVTQYSHKSIINWRTVKIGAKHVFSLVVLSEVGDLKDDGFEVTSKNQWRVLQLIDGIYTVSTWKFDEESNRHVIVEPPTTVFDAAGVPMTNIPFYFCGALNNDPNPDEPALYDLAVLNIAHYRNSADYEDSCYLVGQPTPVFSGLTEQWVNKVFKGKTIQLGSRAAIPLPPGGTAVLLQADANSMPYEAMSHKERQMMALGAKLIEPGAGSNTLGQAQLDQTSESSILGTAANNVATCYTMALKAAARMQGVSEDEVEFTLNTDFPSARLTPNERQELVLEWQAGAITAEEMRAGLRKAGVATVDYDEYKTEIAANPPPDVKAMTNNQNKGGADNAAKTGKDAQNNGGNQAGI